jgi:hypothetical protein
LLRICVSVEILSRGKFPESVLLVEVMKRGLSLCDGGALEVANVAVAPLNIELGVAHHMV